MTRLRNSLQLLAFLLFAQASQAMAASWEDLHPRMAQLRRQMIELAVRADVPAGDYDCGQWFKDHEQYQYSWGSLDSNIGKASSNTDQALWLIGQNVEFRRRITDYLKRLTRKQGQPASKSENLVSPLTLPYLEQIFESVPAKLTPSQVYGLSVESWIGFSANQKRALLDFSSIAVRGKPGRSNARDALDELMDDAFVEFTPSAETLASVAGKTELSRRYARLFFSNEMKMECVGEKLDRFPSYRAACAREAIGLATYISGAYGESAPKLGLLNPILARGPELGCRRVFNETLAALIRDPRFLEAAIQAFDQMGAVPLERNQASDLRPQDVEDLIQCSRWIPPMMKERIPIHAVSRSVGSRGKSDFAAVYDPVTGAIDLRKAIRTRGWLSPKKCEVVVHEYVHAWDYGYLTPAFPEGRRQWAAASGLRAYPFKNETGSAETGSFEVLETENTVNAYATLSFAEYLAESVTDSILYPQQTQKRLGALYDSLLAIMQIRITLQEPPAY